MKPNASEARAFGLRLKEIRESAHLNRVEFAKLLQISPAYVTYLEKGERDGKPVSPTAHFIESVCHRLGCTYEWLATGAGRKNSSVREKVMSRVASLSETDLRRVNRFLDEILRTTLGAAVALMGVLDLACGHCHSIVHMVCPLLVG